MLENSRHFLGIWSVPTLCPYRGVFHHLLWFPDEGNCLFDWRQETLMYSVGSVLLCSSVCVVSSLGADALLWPKSLPGLFLVLVSFLNALSLNSAVFDMSNEHTFPKLGWDVKFPGFCLSDQTWSLSSVFSPRYRLKWRPFLSIISEVISPIFKILTKTVIHLLVVNF